VIRAAVLLLHKKPKVFCTVHGYLFNESDGLKKWIYLLPEKICSSVTNVLMVMNHEDNDIAQKHKLYRDRLYYINGMGIDLDKFHPVPDEKKFSLKKELGLKDNDFLFVYAAEFSKRKNQSMLIHAFANVCKEYPDMKLLLAGNGTLLENCKRLVREFHLEKNILFLGYVSNMSEIYSICNACVTTSLSEGLPFNVMEAMACGLPVIASDIKGHRELTNNGKVGLLFKSGNRKELQQKINLLYTNEFLQEEFRSKGQEQVKKFVLSTVFDQILQIFTRNK
jgi:glycosyltransferase EpsD